MILSEFKMLFTTGFTNSLYLFRTIYKGDVQEKSIYYFYF